MESERTVNHSGKSVLRRQMRTAKQQYAEQLPAMSAAIIKQLKQRLDGCHTVMAYWPLPDEVVTIAAVQFDSGLFDAGHITFLSVQYLDGEFVAFGPADVHAEQHFCPVAAFGAAGARVDGEHYAQRIFLLAHHIAEFQLLQGFHGNGILLVGFLLGGFFRSEKFK